MRLSADIISRYVYVGLCVIISAGVGIFLVFSFPAGWAPWVGGILLAYSLFTAFGEVSNVIGWKAHLGRVLENTVRNLALTGLGSRLRLSVPGSGRCVDFIRINSTRKDLFCMRLDSARCIAGEFEAARKALEAGGIRYRLEERGQPREMRQFLIVECGPNTRRAAQAAHCVFIDCFGLTEESRIKVGLLGGRWPLTRRQLENHPGWTGNIYLLAVYIRACETMKSTPWDKPDRMLACHFEDTESVPLGDAQISVPAGWTTERAKALHGQPRRLRLKRGDASVEIECLPGQEWFDYEAPDSDCYWFLVCEVDLHETRAEYDSDRGFFEAALRIPRDEPRIDRRHKKTGYPYAERRKLAMKSIHYCAGVTQRLKTPHAEGFCVLKTNKKENRFEGTAILFTPEGELIGKLTVEAAPISDEVQRCFERVIASFRKVNDRGAPVGDSA